MIKFNKDLDTINQYKIILVDALESIKIIRALNNLKWSSYI